MSYWAVGAAIVAAAAGYENNQQVARREDNESARQLRQQYGLQQQENQQVQQLIQKTAQSSPDKARSSLLDQFMQELQAKNGNAVRPLAQVGNVSGAYTKAANDAALGISNYGTNNAGLLSAIDAPSVQRRDEAANLSRFGSALNEVKRESAADQFLSQMRLQSIRPNPWLTAVADGARAYSMASAGGGGGLADSSGGAGNVANVGVNGAGRSVAYNPWAG
jgi:hypothetical protein